MRHQTTGYKTGEQCLGPDIWSARHGTQLVSVPPVACFCLPETGLETYGRTVVDSGVPYPLENPLVRSGER